MIQLTQSRPARGGWIEMKKGMQNQTRCESRPARGGWIEIEKMKKLNTRINVPPRKGRVD